MDVTWIKQLALLFMTYLASITVISLLTGTIGIVNNRNFLTDERNEIKYLEKKYNNVK